MKFTNLKKAALAAGLFIGFSVAANAQGPYAKLGLGYNFASGGETLEQRNANQREQIKLNYGQGVVGQAALGYMFNPNIGAELGFGYLAGAKTETKSVYNNRVENHTYHARMVLLQPSIIISAGKEGLNPYAKFGLVAAKGKAVHLEETSHNSAIELEWHSTGGWGLGLQAALGLEVGLSDQLAFFTELSMNNLTYAPHRSEVVMYRHNGADHLPLLRVRDRETEYVDTYLSDDNRHDSLPREQLKENLPFSSVGVNFGVKFNF